MLTKYIVIPPEGEVLVFEAELDDAPSPESIGELCSSHIAGRAERVRVFCIGSYTYTDMFVGRNSAIDGSPVNAIATAIYRHNAALHDKSVDPETLPSIYGVAVLFDRPVWF